MIETSVRIVELFMVKGYPAVSCTVQTVQCLTWLLQKLSDLQVCLHVMGAFLYDITSYLMFSNLSTCNGGISL